ncbi:LacI family DNA-binding transcriptional regulator [Mangrovibacterium lignilyticum]|uniref:LacI family DNA-binding transcriptional regulator n=1 Tax=Mangrovibacterium lignilyticum TaxID=2668052 RepID=UPI0013D5B4CA|nr:LacI family DNA-binding transcriptional regulator [Mangrovibacterium lignilyticum]
MKKNVSLKDIAEKVGVSTALVSYVLNGKMEGRISKEVAAQIKAVAEELNYRPNQIAKSLKTNRTHTLGLLLADIANPFSSQIARIIENEANKLGYTVIIGSSDEQVEKSKSLIQLFLNRQVDGLILSLPENSEEIVSDLKEKGIPFVLLDRYFPEISTNSVTIDNYSAAEAAIKHLQENNIARIGIVTYETSLFHLEERLRGALESCNGNATVGKVRLGNIEEDVEAAITAFLNPENKVEAIFFLSNLLAISGLKYLNKLQVTIPDQLAVIAFDKTDAFDLFYTTITYVNQPMNAMGVEAVKLVQQAISGVPTETTVNLQTELVIQHSTTG